MTFSVVDVETANPDLASICQIGIATFLDGVVVERWQTMVDPEDYFNAYNVFVHGIEESAVKGKPNWKAIWPEVEARLSGRIVISHTPFDRCAIQKACAVARVATCECRWLDSARVVRRTWPDFAHSGYGLNNVAKSLGIDYQAHNALEDAWCAGQIMVQAMALTGFSVSEWVTRSQQPISSIRSEPIQANPEGHLFGNVIVFTGKLQTFQNEAAAAEMAAHAGCKFANRVTRKTTLLVVGDQETRKLSGHLKSQNHRYAEERIAAGQHLRVLGESDFVRILNIDSSGQLRTHSHA